MRLPSGESKTTEQKSPVARDMCSATMASNAPMSGTASLNAAEAAAIAAKRPDSPACASTGGSGWSPDTTPLYSWVMAKRHVLRPNRSQSPSTSLGRYSTSAGTLHSQGLQPVQSHGRPRRWLLANRFAAASGNTRTRCANLGWCSAMSPDRQPSIFRDGSASEDVQLNPLDLRRVEGPAS